MDNLIKSKIELIKFRDDKLKFIVSSRNITPNVSIIDYLKVHYIYLTPEQIKHVFGSVTTPSRLYGGRTFRTYKSLTDMHVKELNKHNIGVSLNLTNHFFDKESYEESFNLLEKYHSPKNSLIITNDELAKNIKIDFPGYKLKASIIKNIMNVNRIENAYEIYDYVTLPMDCNDDDEFLNSIPEKGRIILFANANCAYKCPARTCYYGFSQHNRGEEITSICSKETMPRLDHGPVYFNVEKLSDMGFNHFKLVPLFFEEADNVTKFFSWKKTKEGNEQYYKIPDAFVVSYPKSGRTWLRFILANYFNYLFKLNLKIDLHNFFTLLPNDNSDKQKGLKAYAFYDRQELPFILFSHERKDTGKFKGKVIFLIRSPYDLIVSDFFQQTEHLNSFNGGIKDFIRDNKKGMPRLCSFLNKWVDEVNDKKHFVLSYEELTKNTYTSVKKLLEYLEIEIDDNILINAVENSEFSKMQNLEKEQGLPSPQEYDLANNNALRMREGKNGSYKKYLDEEDIEFINLVMKDRLKEDSKNLLIKHNCVEKYLFENIAVNT